VILGDESAVPRLIMLLDVGRTTKRARQDITRRRRGQHKDRRKEIEALGDCGGNADHCRDRETDVCE
jgi:hypothetical protein